MAIVLTPVTASAAVDEGSPAGRAADWIAREYQAPDSEIALFGTGTLIDAMVSLAATGTESGVALDMLEDLRSAAPDYVGAGATFNPGSAGKTIHVLEVYGEDVAGFVGSDVEAELRASMQLSGDEAGRFGEALVFEQATAILGLALTDDGVPPEAVAYLATQQCDNGEFTFDGACPGPGDADTTGIAALALVAGGDVTVSADAVSWLLSIQLGDGSIPGYGTPNTNSTAAAAQAFQAAGEQAAAEAAAGFLAGMQFPDDAPQADAGGLKWLATDTTANTFATVQGVWGMGVPALYDLVAPTFAFSDTTGSVFLRDVEWIAASGITMGCNPPDNDMFCPTDPVTRGQMAAFLNRALELPTGSGSGFTDVGGSVFSADIEAIAAAGITRGCNPPDNDMFCPDQVVTRGQMAAFSSRAFGLPAGSGSGFTDVGGSVFSGDIEAIAAAGITRGCNPPLNDMFCPDDPVTREQMAAFIYRATHG
jgi:hypothetical protein